MKTYEIEFSSLENWSYPVHRHYQYAFISDQEIEHTITSDELTNFDTSGSWAEQTNNFSTKADNPIHIKQIAKIVLLLNKGKEFPPIKIIAEDDIKEKCGFCVVDGHHRLRAMKYINRKSFQAIVEGDKKNYHELINTQTTL